MNITDVQNSLIILKGKDHSSPKKNSPLRGDRTFPAKFVIKTKKEDKTPQGVMEEAMELSDDILKLFKIHSPSEESEGRKATRLGLPQPVGTPGYTSKPGPDTQPPQPSEQSSEVVTPDMERVKGNIAGRNKKASIEKSVPESLQALRKYHGGIAALANQGGREAEHHQLLREYGFPSEQPQEGMRYIPVVEIETDDCGCPINIKPPWTVNEAGQHTGEVHPEDSAIYKMGVSKVLFAWLEKAGIWSPSSGGWSGGGFRRQRMKVDPGKHAALGKPPKAKRGFRAF